MIKQISILLLLFTLCKVKSQVVVSPEVGVSYSPFLMGFGQFMDGTNHDKSTGLDLLIGFSVQLPIHEKWYIDTRITYNKRNKSEWRVCGGLFCSDYTYKHDNLNIDLRLYRKVSSKVNVGFGPSIIRKVKSALTIDNERGQGEKANYNNTFNYYGLNAGVSYDFNVIRLNIDYMYKLNSDYHLHTLSAIRSRSRINMTISYPLKTGKLG